MEKKVIIGRYGQEGVDSQLLITIGANESTWGQMGSVPQSVSRQHCSIEVMGNGYLIHNLNPMNVTYVNGQPVASKMIGANDVVELGQARYRLDWRAIINNLNLNDNVNDGSINSPQVNLNAAPEYPSANIGPASPANNNPAPRPNYNRPAAALGNNPAPPFSSNQSSNTLLAMIVGVVVLIVFIVGIVSYFNKSSGSSSYSSSSTSSYSSSDTYDDEVEADEPSAPVEEEKTQMVTCPSCNGTGIFDFAPGDIMAPKVTCAGCNGTGMCSAETAKELIKVQQQVNGMMGGGAGNYSSGGYSSGGSTVTCGMCNGTGTYHWPGVPRYSGNSDPQWTNCSNCGQVIDACNSHSCRCRNCNGTGQV